MSHPSGDLPASERDPSPNGRGAPREISRPGADGSPSPRPLEVLGQHPFNAETPVAERLSRVTSTASFYVRCNFEIPALSTSTHTVTIDGAVERPLTLGVGQLQLLGARCAVVTLECAGNGRLAMRPLPPGEPWTDGAVSTGEWTGVSLERVLEQAGLLPEATHLRFEGADRGPTAAAGGREVHFVRALPRAKALDPDTLLAWGLNGEPLPRPHGGPLRLLVPGWYGMASVKWVTRITALTEAFRGPFQGARYVFDSGEGSPPRPVEAMRVKSQILFPRPGMRLEPGPVAILGRAWAGEQAVARVEVEVEGSGRWEEAELLEDPRPHVWVSWRRRWIPSRPGMHVLRVRAVDTAGRIQPEVTGPDRLGYGQHAIEVMRVEVR